MKLQKKYLLGMVLFLAIGNTFANAIEEIPIFSETFTRDTKKPDEVIKTFDVNVVDGNFSISVENGDKGVSSSVIKLNGVEIISPNEFNKNVKVINKKITLKESNELSIELRSKVGSSLVVNINEVLDIDLPPDPKEAGKTTLEGIDSDRDGVRDDIQRYIAINYRHSKDMQQALRQFAKAKQDFLIDSYSKDKTFDNSSKSTRAIECMYSIDMDNAHNIILKLRGEILNTYERIKTSIKAGALLSGGTFPMKNLDDMYTSCIKENQ